MMTSPLKLLPLAALLCALSTNAFAASPPGPTVPTNPQEPHAGQDIKPTITPDAKIHNDSDVPTHPSVDPHMQGNDPGRQGGMNTDGNGPMGDDDDSPASAIPAPSGTMKP